MLPTHRLAAVLLAIASLAGPPAAVLAGEDRKPAPPFTGAMRIRQKEGTLYFDFEVRRGKVISGVCAHKGRNKVMYEIVGGWYDGERLALLLQSPGENLKDPYFSHLNQFRRTKDGFDAEHVLFGYGKTEASGVQYKPHVIDYIAEKPETVKTPKPPK
jgi:hypothetical protein